MIRLGRDVICCKPWKSIDQEVGFPTGRRVKGYPCSRLRSSLACQAYLAVKLLEESKLSDFRERASQACERPEAPPLWFCLFHCGDPTPASATGACRRQTLRAGVAVLEGARAEGARPAGREGHAGGGSSRAWARVYVVFECLLSLRRQDLSVQGGITVH